MDDKTIDWRTKLTPEAVGSEYSAIIALKSCIYNDKVPIGLWILSQKTMLELLKYVDQFRN